MKYLLFISVLFSYSLHACEVNLPRHLMILGDDVSGKRIFQSKDCTDALNDDLQKLITGLEGKISSFQLKELLVGRGHSVEVYPSMIQIQQLKTLIRDQLLLPPGVQVKATRGVNNANFINLAPGDKVEVSCATCLYGIQQPINLTVLGFDGTTQSLLATADFKKMIKAYRLITPLPSFSDIDTTGILKEEFVESIPQTNLITDLSSLKFYKTNKPLKTGDLLRREDLNAVNLVKAGLKTDVILENQMVRIKTQGISRSNGSIGELVEVFHPQKNKKYQGKVVDINKVLVEL